MVELERPVDIPEEVVATGKILAWLQNTL